MYRQKILGNTGKNNNTSRGNKPESSGEKNMIKTISTKGKTIQTNQDVPKQQKEILPTCRDR